MRVQYYMKSKGGQTSEVFYIEGQGYKYIDGKYNKQQVKVQGLRLSRVNERVRVPDLQLVYFENKINFTLYKNIPLTA